VTVQASAAVRQIIDGLFGVHNDASPDEAPRLVELFESTQSAVIPYRRGTGQRWYGFSTDARRARELRNEILAFVGPRWSSWTGPAAELDLREPMEGVLAAVARGPVVRLDPLPGREAAAQEAIRLLADVLSERPELVSRVPRPRHRILSELELAFAAGNAQRARELIDELAATGTLGAINLLFLQIRLYDSASNADAVLDDPDLPDLLRRRRPRIVTLAIARAVQARHLAPFEELWRQGDQDAAASALDSFGELSADFQSIFADRALLARPEFVPAVVAHHLMRGEEDQAFAVLERSAPESQAWPRALIEAVSPPERVRTEQPAIEERPEVLPFETLARQSFEAGDYFALLELAQRAPRDAVSVDYAVRAAYNLDTLAAAKQALAIVASASDEVLRDARRDRAFRDAEALLRGYIPSHRKPEDMDPSVSSWREWFEGVAGAPEWAAALAVAERGRYEWPSAALGSAVERESLTAAITQCANDAAAHSAALGGLVHFLDWLDDAPPEVDVANVVAAALDLLLYAAESSEDRDNLSMRLFGTLAAADSDAVEVGERLRDFAELWNEVAAPKRLDWPLALLDIAIDFFGRAAAVNAFFGAVLASVGLWPDRIDRSQVLTLRSIASDLGEEAAAIAVLGEPEEREDGDPLSALKGKAVGIYTLTPGVATRVVRTLSERCPTASVEVNSDFVSTEQLRALARRADVMVVAFQSAKHAATDAIIAARGRSKVLPARGKGSAGILRSLEDWAADVAT
jgi:hypothetical protein